MLPFFPDSKLERTESIILCGIEAHACILHTTLDLLEKRPEVDVHVAVDCVSSRNPVDRKYALRKLAAIGAHLTTSECIVLGLAADSSHPHFKALSKLVREPSDQTGLLDF